MYYEALYQLKLSSKRIAIIITLFFGSIYATAQSTFIFRFEDAQTGVRVIPKRLLLTSRNSEKTTYTLTNKQISDSGISKVNVPDGTYDIEVEADGYKLMNTWFEMQAKELKVRMRLDSKQPNQQMTPDYLGKYRGKQIMVITGILTDETTGLPIAGATVAPADKIVTTTTDSKGHYLLLLPLAGNENELTQRGRLVFTKDGYTTEIRERFDMWPYGDLILPLRMSKGAGANTANVIEKREIHRELLKP